ncbi:hypothetical protein P7K49_019521 [Saguinus oedipus]|uniref:Uncharacterized protein n=1 Tax=Saguinus oedipus TaxID=9490 RepID=A0ABQ9UXL5_SAGOE|nr:hypothetical protein P7K49_019521 [Saguinus oedipus]
MAKKKVAYGRCHVQLHTWQEEALRQPEKQAEEVGEEDGMFHRKRKEELKNSKKLTAVLKLRDSAKETLTFLLSSPTLHCVTPERINKGYYHGALEFCHLSPFQSNFGLTLFPSGDAQPKWDSVRESEEVMLLIWNLLEMEFTQRTTITESMNYSWIMQLIKQSIDSEGTEADLGLTLNAHYSQHCSVGAKHLSVLSGKEAWSVVESPKDDLWRPGGVVSRGPRARRLPPVLVAGGAAVLTLASPGTLLSAAALLVPWRGLGRRTATFHRRVAEGLRVPKGVFGFRGLRDLCSPGRGFLGLPGLGQAWGPGLAGEGEEEEGEEDEEEDEEEEEEELCHFLEAAVAQLQNTMGKQLMSNSSWFTSLCGSPVFWKGLGFLTLCLPPKPLLDEADKAAALFAAVSEGKRTMLLRLSANEHSPELSSASHDEKPLARPSTSLGPLPLGGPEPAGSRPRTCSSCQGGCEAQDSLGSWPVTEPPQQQQGPGSQGAGEPGSS